MRQMLGQSAHYDRQTIATGDGDDVDGGDVDDDDHLVVKMIIVLMMLVVVMLMMTNPKIIHAPT